MEYEDTYDYDTDIVNDKPRIKIGSSHVTIDKGLKNYIIKYTNDMGSDPYDGYDEFIFHAYGDFWGTEIKNPSLEVTMPKEVEGNKVRFFMDKVRKYDVTKAVDYKINNNVITAKFNKDKFGKLIKNGTYKRYPKKLEKSLTIDIELPDNYFDNGAFNYGNKSLTCIIICIAIAVLTFLLWLIFGKDYEKKISYTCL